MMGLEVTCPRCGFRTTFGDETAGREGYCQGCGGRLSIPNAPSSSAAARVLDRVMAAARQGGPQAAPPAMSPQLAGEMLAGVLGRVMQGRDSIVLRINPEKRDDDYRNYAGWTVVLYATFALTRLCTEKIGDERTRQDIVMALFNAFVGPERLTDFLSQSEPILRRMGQAFASGPDQGPVGAALLVHEYLFDRAQPTPQRIEPIVDLYTEVYNAGIRVLDRLCAPR